MNAKKITALLAATLLAPGEHVLHKEGKSGKK